MHVPELGFLALIAGAALVYGDRARAAAVSAAVATGLALAGFRAAAMPAPAGFLAVTSALALAGVALAVLGGALAPRDGTAARRLLGPSLVVAGAVGTALGLSGVVAGAPGATLLLALVIVAAGGSLLHVIGRWVRFPQDRRADTPWWRRTTALGLILGAAAAVLGRHLGLVVLGAILSAWAAHVVSRDQGGSRLPLAPLLTLPLLAAWWLMATIAGAAGLGIASLPIVPLSPAAERLLAPVFLVATWAMTGLWPLHRQTRGALAAPVAAVLIVRVIAPALPDGLEHWRPLAMPLVLLGLWHAALSGRWSSVMVGLAWIGLLGGTPGGQIGGALLLVGALLVELRPRMHPAVAGIPAGMGALLAVEAGLHTEVVYTVLGAAALVAATGYASRAAMIASDRSTTDPSA